MNPNAIVLVLSSDHIIQNVNAFHEAIEQGLPQVKRSQIVTFGIKPTRPETGYGYLQLSENPTNDAVALEGFIEKPSLEIATELIKDPRFMWNAGIFMFCVADMVIGFQQHAMDIYQPVEQAVNSSTSDLGFVRLDPLAWSETTEISFDYAIMEKINNVMAIPFYENWSDLGGWDVIHQEMIPNEMGVALSENAHAIDCRNTLLRSESTSQQIVGLGLDDMIAVSTSDAVLIAHKSQTQNIKKVVSELKTKGVSQATEFPRDYRPWGWYETLALAPRFQVKHIFVNPGAALSLQSHHHRSEHWWLYRVPLK